MITKISASFDEAVLESILKKPYVFIENNHIEYPESLLPNRIGNHLDNVFIFDRIAQDEAILDYVVSDMHKHFLKTGLEFDLIFAPNQPSVVKMVEKLAGLFRVEMALWEFLPQGWFGDKLVSGSVDSSNKVLVVNGLSQQGRCIGSRLPQFVSSYGANVVGASVFATGNNNFVQEAASKYGANLYRAIEIDIKIYSPDKCPICLEADLKLIPWTYFANLPISEKA